jgi:hypothetical protein
MKLPDQLIIEKLESLNEHKMAREIFVPLLKKMDVKGVKYVGGSDEHGIDVEYYETSEPDRRRKYTGIQFKKGTLKYGAGGNKNTVKEVKNQAEEAFEKEIYGIDNDSKNRIHRFICAVTGSINETARRIIGKAKLEHGGQIDYWDGEYLCGLIREHWKEEFIDYFDLEEDDIDEVTNEDESEKAIDALYIEENHTQLVDRARKVRATVDGMEWSILKALVKFFVFERSPMDSGVTMADLLIEVGKTQYAIADELQHLRDLDYIEVDSDGTISLSGRARSLYNLADKIQDEIMGAAEDTDEAESIFESLL